MEKRLSDSIQLFTACATTKQEVKHTCGPPAGRAQPLPPHPTSQSYKGEVTSHFLLLCQGFLFLLSVQVPVWLWCPGALSHCCLYRLTLFFFFFFSTAQLPEGDPPLSWLLPPSVRPPTGAPGQLASDPAMPAIRAGSQVELAPPCLRINACDICLLCAKSASDTRRQRCARQSSV